MGSREPRERDNDRSFLFPMGIPYRPPRVGGSRRTTTTIKTRNTCWVDGWMGVVVLLADRPPSLIWVIAPLG